MNEIKNLLDTLHRAHCDNAQQAYYAKPYRGISRSTMPATSFVFEFFLFNSIYQYDWQSSLDSKMLRPWPNEILTESQQQSKLERVIRNQCKSRSDILRRAFDPLIHIEDLDGAWTEVTPDPRISREHGRSFFRKLSKLRDTLAADKTPEPTGAIFELIGNCRYFVYLVRNNIFHGSKSIGEIYEPEQRRRIEVYDIFLKSLVSLFFLAVDREPVAADYVQLPVRIPFPNREPIIVGQSEVVDCVVSGCMKSEDSRLISAFFSGKSVSSKQPNSREALFYPSSGRDLLTPVLLSLPFCSQFFFYDNFQQNRTQLFERNLRKILDVQLERESTGEGDKIRFEFLDIPRTIHLLQRDNLDFLTRDVDLVFYFHRGDSPGEGGSGQAWDSFHIVDLGHQVAETRVCQVLTDGEPGGLHPDLRSLMRPVSIPLFHRNCEYFLGEVSKNFLRDMKKNESGSGHIRM